MRRRLEQLLNDRFEYEVPHLLLSETEVALTLDEGQNFRGELNIGAEDGRRVKGIVTTDHQRIVLAKNQFQGTASTIEYGVDTSGLKAGDEICGNITVSSNLEERCVRVHVSIAGKTMNISGQEIHSLADFVHLASHDFGAAYRFFVKKEFARLLQKEAPEQIVDCIVREFHRDATWWEAKGGYTDDKTYMVMTILSKYECEHLRPKLKRIDEHAFVVVKEGMRIAGKYEKHL